MAESKYLDVTVGNTSRDYVTIFNDLTSLLPYVCPEWTYTGDDDPGTAILQLLAYLADHLHYRADATLRDMLPTTSLVRGTVVAFADWMGYPVKGRQSAAVDLTFSVPVALAQDVLIPMGTRVAASDIYYEVVEDGVLEAGSTSISLTALEGVSVNALLLGTTSGAAFESFAVPDLNIIYNHQAADLQIWVGGQEAELVRWPALAAGGELVFWVREQGNGQLVVRFGNGKYGAIPSRGQAVTAFYRIGGGVRGRVGANVLTQIVDALYMTDGSPATTVTVTNPLGSLGGTDADTVADIQQRAPAYFKAQDRAVTLADYEANVLAAENVFAARAAVSGLSGVNIYVVPTGATGTITIPAAMQLEIDDILRYRKMSTDVVNILPATLVPVDIALNVAVLPNFRRSTVLNSVQLALSGTGSVFDRNNLALGQPLRFSDMIRVLEELSGVNYVQVSKYTRRPAIVWSRNTGGATLTGATLYQTTQEQTWQIRFITATTYSVTGSVLGLQGALGTVGSVYTIPGEFSFTVTAGGSAMAIGDMGDITIGRLVWDISFAPNELPEFGTLTLTGTGGY